VSTHTSARRGPWLVLCLMLCVVWLGGCAGPTELRTQVSTFGNWPAERQAGAYVFERLPSQDSQPLEQAELEAAAQPALSGAGFKLADKPEQAQYKVQLGLQVQVDRRTRYDPFLYPYRPYGPYGPYGPHPYGPVYRAPPKPGQPPRLVYPAMGGWWGSGGRGGLAFSMSMEPPWVQMQVSVLIREAHSNQVLYEARAACDRMGTVDTALLAPLFKGALQGFPQAPAGARMVTVPLGQEPPPVPLPDPKK